MFHTVCHIFPLQKNRNTPKHISRMPGICQVHFQLFVIRKVCFELEVKIFSISVPNFNQNFKWERFRPATNDTNTFPPLGSLITFRSKDFVLRNSPPLAPRLLHLGEKEFAPKIRNCIFRCVRMTADWLIFTICPYVSMYLLENSEMIFIKFSIECSTGMYHSSTPAHQQKSIQQHERGIPQLRRHIRRNTNSEYILIRSNKMRQ